MKTQKIIMALATIGMVATISSVAQAAAIFSFESASADANLTYPAVRTQHDDALYGLSYSETLSLDVGTAADLTDDLASDKIGNGTTDGQFIFAANEGTWTLTYALGGALDISEIRLYSNNEDSRVSQSYDVAYSTDGVNYTSIISGVTQIYRADDDTDFLMSRVIDDAGTSLASAATHLQFTLYPVRHGNENPAYPLDGHSAIYEIDVFETAAEVPEPSFLVLLGTGALLGLVLRRRNKQTSAVSDIV